MRMHPCEQVGLDFVETAPVRFSNDVDLALTPEQTFEVLARADTWPRWAKVITHVEYTSAEPHGVGTTRTVTMRAGLVGEEEFLAWEPGRRLAFRFNAASTNALSAFVEDYHLAPSARGCRLTWKLGQRLAGPSRHLAPLTRPVTNLAFQRFLKNLRRLTDDGVPAI